MHRTIAAALALVLGAALGAGGSALLRPCGSARAVALLDVELPHRARGEDFVFTVAAPGDVEVRVRLPEGCVQGTSATLGPLFLALRPDPVYETDREPEHRFEVLPAEAPWHRVALARGGPYVLRVEPIPMAMGGESGAVRTVHVEVRRP